MNRNSETLAALPRVLTIAGSDSGGGAGIEADLKTMTALGCYGMAAITSVTAQNTVAVTAIHDLPPEIVAAQIDAVLEDIGADAAKIGMLSNAGIIEALADSLARHPIERLVVDPVMIAKSGDALLRPEAQQALIDRILPLAFVVTPNVPEAEALSACAIASEADLAAAANAILKLGPRYVLMKGGHLDSDEATDMLYGPGLEMRLSAPRIDTANTHGTGCTYSAAIAAYLAMGRAIDAAAAAAKDYLTGAIADALPLGSGHGPLNHMWRGMEE